MTRKFIVVGDTTSSGGKVLAGSPFTDIQGMQVCRVSDPVLCGRHGAQTIATGDASCIIDQLPVAREGDLCSCGCSLVSLMQMSTTTG